MKLKLTLLFLILVTLVSCTDVLDKKIKKENLEQDITDIGKKYQNVYNKEDLESLAGYVIWSEISKTKDTKTYREVLDKSRNERLEAEKIIAQNRADFKAKHKEISNAVSTNTTDVNVKYNAIERPSLFTFTQQIKNKSNKDIDGILIDIYIADVFGDYIDCYTIEYTQKIGAGATIAPYYSFDTYVGDYSKRLVSGDPSKLKIKPIVSKIAFSDGTIIENNTLGRSEIAKQLFNKKD